MCVRGRRARAIVVAVVDAPPVRDVLGLLTNLTLTLDSEGQNQWPHTPTPLDDVHPGRMSEGGTPTPCGARPVSAFRFPKLGHSARTAPQ